MRGDSNFAVGIVVLNRVGQKIRDDLRDAFGIAGDFERRQLGSDFHAAFVREQADQLDAIACGPGQIKFHPLHLLLPGIEAREFEQRADQFAHPLRGALAGFDGLAVFGRGAFAVKRGLRLREHHRDRRAEFVRGVGRELFLLRERGVEARERGIQDGGELAEFAFGLGDVDALRQIAGGNFRGGGTDFNDWPQ